MRAHYRQVRRALPQQRQLAHATQLAAIISSTTEFRRAKTIASYWPSDGEISPEIIHQLAWREGKQLYLPCLFANKQAPNRLSPEQKPQHSTRMSFAPYNRNTELTDGLWGIRQPRDSQLLDNPLVPDLLLVPLVAFDSAGNRLGRGGGFYDRYIAMINQGASSYNIAGEPAGKSMQIFGLAHSLQQQEPLPIESWDQPLDAVVTEKALLRCQR